MTTYSTEAACATSWMYFAEGNHHALFRFIGRSEDFQHMVLRLPKDMGKSKREYSTAEEYSYYRNVSIPLIGRTYLLNMFTIEITPQFVRELQEQSFSLRPEHRRSKPLHCATSTAFVMKDLTQLCNCLPRSLTAATWSNSVTVEIKVKCGLRSISPLAHPLKRQLSRYAFTQYVRMAQASKGDSVPWGVYQGISKYDPHELCSGQMTRVKEQLHHLLHNPQNNFKLSINSQHVYGLDMTDLLVASSALQGAMSCGTDAISSLIACLAHILSTEELCQRLEKMQKLDSIDIEGAALVYMRLISLHNGDEDATHSVIRSALLAPTNNNTDFLQQNLTDAERCVSWLQSCAAPECIALLRRWLLSLAACDASVVITLCPLENTNFAGNSTVQEQDQAGVVLIDEGLYAYTMKCIDIGPKPVWKIQSHIECEEKMCTLAQLGLQLSH